MRNRALHAHKAVSPLNLHGTLTSGSVGPLMRVTGTLAASSIPVWRGQTGSIMRLLMLQILSHSCTKAQLAQ